MLGNDEQIAVDSSCCSPRFGPVVRVQAVFWETKTYDFDSSYGELLYHLKDQISCPFPDLSHAACP